MAGPTPAAALLLLASLVLAGCAATPKAAPDGLQRAQQDPPVEASIEEGAEASEPAEATPSGPQQEPPAQPDPEEPAQPSPQPPSEEEGTTVYEKRLDVLVDQTFLPLPAIGAMSTKAFTAAYPYQTLEVVGRYTLPEYADWLKVSVVDGAGKEVISYNSLDSSVAGGGSSWGTFPIGYAYDIVPGEYTVTVDALGTGPVDLQVRGHLGADMDFSFDNVVTGARDQVANYRGQVVLIDLMATWCGPCRDAMPGLAQIRADYGRQVEILSIDVDLRESREELLEMRSEFNAAWPFGFDDRDEASDDFGTGWIPSFGIVDQHGVLLYRHIGEMEPDDIRRIIDYALENR